MNRIQIHLVRRSVSWFEPCGSAMVAAALRTLADRCPGTRALFPENTARWHDSWFRTLWQIVENSDRFHRLEGPLREIGAAAASEGLTAAHCGHCRDALLEAMRSLSGEDWTEDLENAWVEILDAASGAILVGTIERRRAA